MGQRLFAALLGLAFGLCVIVTLAAAQAPEEALLSSGAPLPVIGNELTGGPCDDLGDATPMGARAPVQAWIVHPTLAKDPQENPHPGTAPALCPRLKPPHPENPEADEGTMISAGGAPDGGAFQWGFSPNTGGEAWYQSTTCGMATQVGVTYTVEGEGAASADSGYIRVFDAELTFDGGSDDPQATQEDDPGFFMAVGPQREALALTLDPSDPDCVMPDDGAHPFDDTEPHGGPAPRIVSLGGVGGHVEAYAQAEGGTPMVGPGLVWGWEDAGIGEFYKTAPPAQVYVQAVSAGEAVLTFTVDIFCPDECYGWYAPPSSACDQVKITVFNLLTAWDLDGQLADDKEEDPGAFVHYNVDNDNASNNALGSPKHPGGDYLETGPVAGEDDLKRVKMCVGSTIPSQGVMTLSRGGAGLKVWKSATKGAANAVLVDLDQKQWDLSNTNQRNQFIAWRDSLYVEGCAGGTSSLTLTYTPPGGQPDISDTVNYTFIAADCGDQPRTDSNQRQYFGSRFPLKRCEWSVTGAATNAYNCIAYSVGLDDRKVYSIGDWNDPDESIDWDYGDQDDDFEYPGELDLFYASAKHANKYYPTATGPADADVMYYTYFHAARKKACGRGAGRWIMFESKWGPKERIEHVWNQLNGLESGEPIRFYKK